MLAAGAFFLPLLFATPLLAEQSAIRQASAQPPTDKSLSAELGSVCNPRADTGPEMVLIAAGDFKMGSPEGEAGRYDDESPQHAVTISRPFALGRCEVTVGEFRRFVEATAYKTSAERGAGCRSLDKTTNSWKENPALNWRNPGFAPYDERHPVVCVSWDDAQAYIAWLNRELGLPANTYRLPSEAEWEYAARAGSDTAYFWGDAEQCGFANGADQTTKQSNSDLIDKAWTFADCSDGFAFTAPVASLQANGFGLFDTTGNAVEWVQDCWHDKYDGAPKDGSAWEPGTCEQRALRGGSWLYRPSNLRSAYRGRGRPDEANDGTGFRLARTL
ncbi:MULTISPECIES: formylglycine-generating enzyme family protein [Methylomonas]|uniref:formylglycine-generating enzyme family protein n=1 Tax=Methylomonas TaxID=416 RepID=UPI0018D4C04A|nr:formylglycine-generating enzyme family protein [Methylomonas koyamae]